jgi:CRISP-associated protein Cas1
MKLQVDETEAMSFEDGFAFLGDDVIGDLPVPTADRQVTERRTLYVGSQGARINMSRGKLVVSRSGLDLIQVPVAHVARLVLFGAVGLSAGARSHALYQAVPVVLLSRRGRYLGRLDGSDSAGTATRRLQYAASADPAGRVAVARSVVAGKIANQRALLLRYGRGDDPSGAVLAAADRLSAFGRLAAGCDDVGRLLGMEGVAAKCYFAAFGQLLPAGHPFPGRRRRPPTDLVNAMLSLGYACLTGEAVGAVAAAGLDPGIGLLHADADRPSLALDLVEEFRPVVVDTVVLNCLRRNVVTASQVTLDRASGGVFLKDAARNAFLAQLEERMLTRFAYTPIPSRVTYRRALHLQARQLSVLLRAESLGDASRTYQTVQWR